LTLGNKIRNLESNRLIFPGGRNEVPEGYHWFAAYSSYYK